MYAQPNYEEQVIDDVREQTEVNCKVVTNPDEDLDDAINMETTAEDQAEGNTAEEMNVLNRKQAFLSNFHGMLEGYAQHTIYKQEEFIDRIENEFGGIENFSARLVGTAVGDNKGDFLEANNPEFVRCVAIALVQEFLRRERWYLKLSGEKGCAT